MAITIIVKNSKIAGSSKITPNITQIEKVNRKKSEKLYTVFMPRESDALKKNENKRGRTNL
ncbi:hypothetical protein WMO40_12590 [Bacillaceae bacterium CLA-AA-H227]|uniref:Uncharacterized protein n=1 Tax=Robertmurraya yapensis (ex Hitch et al 2024) TaxID=3133160 RepID=A0ACC6SC64_9BACI